MLFLLIKIFTRQTGALSIQIGLCFLILFVLYPSFTDHAEAVKLNQIVSKLSPVQIDLTSASKLSLQKPSLGNSNYFNRPVAQLIQSHLGHTVSLFACTIGFSIITVLGLSMLVIQQVRWAVKILDNLGRSIEALPIFILSILVMMFINLGIFHYESVQDNFPKANFLVSLSVLCLEYILILYLSTNSYYKTINQEKFIVNIKSKGRTLLEQGFGVILKQVLIQIFSLPSKLGLVLISLLFIEYLFHDQGLGHLFFKAFYHRDQTLIFGLLGSILILLSLTKFLFKLLTVFLSDPDLQLES